MLRCPERLQVILEHLLRPLLLQPMTMQMLQHDVAFMCRIVPRGLHSFPPKKRFRRCWAWTGGESCEACANMPSTSTKRNVQQWQQLFSNLERDGSPKKVVADGTPLDGSVPDAHWSFPESFPGFSRFPRRYVSSWKRFHGAWCVSLVSFWAIGKSFQASEVMTLRYYRP